MSISSNQPEMAVQAESVLNSTQNTIETLNQQITINHDGIPGNTNSVDYSSLDFLTGKRSADNFLSPDFENIPKQQTEAKVTHVDVDYVDNADFLQSNSIERYIITRNESLKGDTHPITGVPFEKRTVTDAEGNPVTGVFPKFDSQFDAKLPEDKLQATDGEQFGECNKQLKEATENDSELAKKFTPDQLEQIKNGDTPDGYTWHHNEEKGKMQLVDSETHAHTGHTGGRSIWGGGSEFR